jgi:calcineurin-like phosphoesterase family protein
MTVWFTSDHHFGHAKILEYSNRPFSNIDEMNSTLIKNWNASVKPSESVYFLGDFALCKEDLAIEIIKQLNGNKYWIFGNHDRYLKKSKRFCGYWSLERDMMEIDINGQKIVLCHYALRTWHSQHRGAWNIHGHSHGSLPRLPGYKQIDVGVDCWDMKPVSFDTLKEEMDKISFKPVDHHGARGFDSLPESELK